MDRPWVVRRIPSPPRERERLPEVLSQAEIERLLRACVGRSTRSTRCAYPRDPQPLAVASAATGVRAMEPRDEPVERSVRDRALAATEERNTALTSGKAGGYV